MLWSSGGVHVESDGAREDEENERRQLANDQNTSCEGWSVVFMERSSMAASRAALLTASQVAAYGEVKRLWIQMVPNAKDDWMAHVGASAAAGLITTATTNPVDVVKTRMFISGEGKKLSAKEAAMEVVREYGALRGAMRGFTANYIRLGPQTMVTFVVAEELRKWFGLESLK